MLHIIRLLGELFYLSRIIKPYAKRNIVNGTNYHTETDENRTKHAIYILID